MRSRMTGKVKVVMAIFGVALSTSGLEADRFDIFSYKNSTPHFDKFCEHIGGLSASDISSHWRWRCDSSYEYSDFLRGDNKVSDKIKQVLKKGDEGAQNVQRYLEFLTSPRFSEMFFSPMKQWFPRNKNGLRFGQLCFCIERKKLKKDSPAFEDFGKYDLYLVRYEELSTGCFFEMIYCFEADDGAFAGWYPTRLMAEWMARPLTKGMPPDEDDRLSFCERFSNFGSKTHTLGVKDFE